MRELLHSVAVRAARYLEDIQERRVSPSEGAVRDLARFDEPLPEGPTAPQDVIRMLDEVGSPATMGIAGRRFFGFVIGGSLPAALGANSLAFASGQNDGPAGGPGRRGERGAGFLRVRDRRFAPRRAARQLAGFRLGSNRRLVRGHAGFR